MDDVASRGESALLRATSSVDTRSSPKSLVPVMFMPLEGSTGSVNSATVSGTKQVHGTVT